MPSSLTVVRYTWPETERLKRRGQRGDGLAFGPVASEPRSTSRAPPPARHAIARASSPAGRGEAWLGSVDRALRLGARTPMTEAAATVHRQYLYLGTPTQQSSTHVFGDRMPLFFKPPFGQFVSACCRDSRLVRAYHWGGCCCPVSLIWARRPACSFVRLVLDEDLEGTGRLRNKRIRRLSMCFKQRICSQKIG